MSYITIKAIWPDGKTEDIEDLKNSHGFGPYIWSCICKKYLHDEMAWIKGRSGELWPLWKKKSIPIHQRVVLAMTYDMAYVEKANFARAANDIKLFMKDFPLNPERANHLPRIAKVFESTPDVPIIGFSGSLSDDLWQGEYNEEAEEYGLPDMPKAFNVYFEIDAMEESCKTTTS